MPKYECIDKTAFRGDVWRSGQTMVLEDDPGEIAHFKRLADPVPEPEKDEAEDEPSQDEAVEALWPKARSAGMKRADLVAAVAKHGAAAVREALDKPPEEDDAPAG